MTTLAVIVLVANPTAKQYAWKEALDSYCALADEVIVIDGGEEELNYYNDKLRIVKIPDPEIWNWAEHAKRLNRGLDESSSDWTIKVDIDWVFHEADMGKIKDKLHGGNDGRKAIATMQKVSFYPLNKKIMKGEIPVAVHKDYKNRVRFGKDKREYTDLTYPIFWEGEVDEYEVPVGKLIKQDSWFKTGENFWNFDYTFTTLEIAKKKFMRMSQAHEVYFGRTGWGKTEEEALQTFLSGAKSKADRGSEIKNYSEIPVFIRERIINLKPEEFGYNGWELLS